MELRHLRYFVAVAEELHFRRAADRLHVAQPAVSAQVRKLEDELGVRLLERTHRSVTLTGPGVTMLHEARRLLEQVDLARVAVRNAHEQAASRLRVGYLPTCLPASIPRVLQRLSTAVPNLQSTLEPGLCLELIGAVRERRLDAAIVSLPSPIAGLRRVVLCRQRAVAVLPLDHDLALRDEIQLTQLAPDRIVVLPRETNRAFHDAVVASCHEAGISPTLVETLDASIERVLLAIASGGGMALLPESVAERYLPAGVALVPVVSETLLVPTAVITRTESQHVPTIAFLRAISSTQAKPARTAGRPTSAAAA